MRWVQYQNKQTEYSLRRIAEIVVKEKRKHDFIVALFQLYLEHCGIPKSHLIIMEEYKGLNPDIVWIHNGYAVLIFEIMDPSANIRDPSIRRRYETLLVLPYIKVIRPWYVVLTDGISMYIYNYEFKLVYQNDNLLEITPEEEKRIKKLLFLA